MMLLFVRGCDFYSTSLWFFEHPEGEMNPLARFFGVGWNGLILANIIVVAFIIYACYFYYFKHVVAITAERPVRLTDYISEIYFQEKGKFYQILYKSPKKRKNTVGASGICPHQGSYFWQHPCHHTQPVSVLSGCRIRYIQRDREKAAVCDLWIDSVVAGLLFLPYLAQGI